MSVNKLSLIGPQHVPLPALWSEWTYCHRETLSFRLFPFWWVQIRATVVLFLRWCNRRAITRRALILPSLAVVLFEEALYGNWGKSVKEANGKNMCSSLNRNMHTKQPLKPLQVKDYLARFQGIPDLLELDHLTVSGDVWFGKDVSLKVIFMLLCVSITKIWWLCIKGWLVVMWFAGWCVRL